MEEIKKFKFKEGLQLEFEIVSISNLLKQQKDILSSPHRTSFYHIVWFQEGNPTHLADFKPLKVEPNTIIFLNKDTVQIFDPKEEYEAKGILFTENFFCKTDNNFKFLRSTILFNNLLEVSLLRLNSIQSIFSVLFTLMEKELDNQGDAFQAEIVRNYLHSFMLLAERERRKQDFVELKKCADLDYTILFKQLVDDQFKQNKSVSSYASQMCITEKRLNVATTKILGTKPKVLIDERVVLEAKRLLAHTNESIKEIGFELGFQEPTNFIKYFRKHTGSTPQSFGEQFHS